MSACPLIVRDEIDCVEGVTVNRILTTHAGSLIRPPELFPFLAAMERGEPVDEQAHAKTLKEAVAREVLEETSLVIEPVGLAGFRETVVRDAQDRVERHFVILCFAARWVGGEPSLNEELSEARWLRPAELTGLPTTPGLAEIVAAAFERLRQAG